MKKLLFMLPLLFLLFSCRDELKIPTDVSFRMDMDKAGSITGLTFQEGYVYISAFEFDGDREKGEDIYFEEEFEPGLKASFTPSASLPEMDFEIPQGIYKRIEIEFDVFKPETQPSLLVHGRYQHPDGNIYPVIFEFASAETFEITAQSADGSNIIVLNEDIPARAIIKFNPGYWFASTTAARLNDAEITFMNGEATILINEETNEDIYDTVADRIEESTEVIFK